MQQPPPAVPATPALPAHQVQDWAGVHWFAAVAVLTHQTLPVLFHASTDTHAPGRLALPPQALLCVWST